MAADTYRLSAAHPSRFLLGPGSSHAPLAAALGQQYQRPLHHLAGFLDRLDAAPQPVPVGQRVLAALGPKALAFEAAVNATVGPERTEEAADVQD